MMRQPKQLPLVIHIPHAGTIIPAAEQSAYTNPSAVEAELNRLTDWFTDELFAVDGATLCTTPFSRLLVDLERFTDDVHEPKAQVGQGVIYENDSLGQRIRLRPTEKERQRLLSTYYHPKHYDLQAAIANRLKSTGNVLLIDAHSFPAEPLANESDQGKLRPDICIGTCSNTPPWLATKAQQLCHANGWTTAINFPYEGCLVPTAYAGDERLSAVMIEVNRALYLDQATQATRPMKNADFERIKAALHALVLQLSVIT